MADKKCMSLKDAMEVIKMEEKCIKWRDSLDSQIRFWRNFKSLSDATDIDRAMADNYIDAYQLVRVNQFGGILEQEESSITVEDNVITEVKGDGPIVVASESSNLIVGEEWVLCPKCHASLPNPKADLVVPCSYCNGNGIVIKKEGL